jgi:hypothetical protein
MPTFAKLPAGKAHGLSHQRVTAAYGMGTTRATIAPCDQAFKPLQIAAPTWKYRQGAAGQGLVKRSEPDKGE